MLRDPFLPPVVLYRERPMSDEIFTESIRRREPQDVVLAHILWLDRNNASDAFIEDASRLLPCSMATS